MKRIAVLTSGGDAPGMNAAIRAVVRGGIAAGTEMFGVLGGYGGLITGAFQQLGARDVGGIIDRGGTMLGTGRCDAMRLPPGQESALANLRHHAIDALIVIGGDGSQTGAAALAARGMPVVGVVSTIDNDVCGVDLSIGATTAVETALDAIGRLRVTASSHHRAFLVEVMGRNCGYLALIAGIAGGAEAVVIPEVESDAATLAAELRDAYARGKSHAIVVVAEGARNNGAVLEEYFRTHRERLGFELRLTRLGHVQRGGAPGVVDRLMATQLGLAAVDCAVSGHYPMLLGMCAGRVLAQPFSVLTGQKKPLDAGLLEAARLLSR